VVDLCSELTVNLVHSEINGGAHSLRICVCVCVCVFVCVCGESGWLCGSLVAAALGLHCNTHHQLATPTMHCTRQG